MREHPGEGVAGVQHRSHVGVSASAVAEPRAARPWRSGAEGAR